MILTTKNKNQSRENMKVFIASFLQAVALCGAAYMLGSPQLSGLRPAFADEALTEFHQSASTGIKGINLAGSLTYSFDPYRPIVNRLNRDMQNKID
jgi:hypothetical protein